MITTTTVEAGGEVAFAGVADVNIRRYDAWRALPGAFRREGRKYTPARGLTVRVAIAIRIFIQPARELPA